MVNELRILDPNIWKACAGSSIQIPIVDSWVYYFPQGHAEQALSPPDFSSSICFKPMILCRVDSILFLANPHSDEVFAKIRLEPFDRYRAGIFRTSPTLGISNRENNDGEEKVLSFAKILTSSDANNGGGFSVPRFCAESIFPLLNLNDYRPLQTISLRDVHGVLWDFRHIYRGSPKRHLLTTGWSKFVNQKKLIAGDSVIFMKNRTGDLSVGIRRSKRSSVTVDSPRWNLQIALAAKLEQELCSGESFWRSNRGRVSAESVREAAELAGTNRPFEIIYDPKAGLLDFMVEAQTVEESLRTFWKAGMRVKMSVETEGSSRMTWFQGTVSSAAGPDHGPWHGSPWRMLQVTWDEPEVLQNIKRVSPWQVELVAGTPPHQTPLPPTKKPRVSQNPELLTDGEGGMFFPMTGLTNSMMGHLDPSLFSYPTFPAGMQGARHDWIFSSFSNFVANSTHHMLYSEHLYGDMAPKLSSVSTELSIGSTPQSDNSLQHSPGSSTELPGNQTCNSMTKAGGASFRLFGKTIQINQPVAGGCTEDGTKGYKETEGVTNPLEPSLSYPYKKLYNSLDAQCQRVSACSL